MEALVGAEYVQSEAGVVTREPSGGTACERELTGEAEYVERERTSMQSEREP